MGGGILAGIIALIAIAVITFNALPTSTPAYPQAAHTPTTALLSSSPIPPASVSESPTPPAASGFSVFYDKQPPYAKTVGGPRINLISNEKASDPTWQQLMAFLAKDTTDSEKYDPVSFPCGAFAEEVQNNAEAAGIKAAWVAIDFTDSTEGHALNAFNTTDKGLVFVDCTGPGWDQQNIKSASISQVKTFGIPTSWDKIAYVVIGKEYGLISASVASSPDYSFYLQYCEKRDEFFNELDSYNNEVAQYTQSVSGKVFYSGSAEANNAVQWGQSLEAKERELSTLGDSLGAFWEPLGIVSKVEIYW